MRRIYAKDCYFYRKKNGVTCAAKQKWCLICGMHVPIINDLQARDYVGLATSRVSSRMAFVFSSLALIISIVSLCLR